MNLPHAESVHMLSLSVLLAQPSSPTSCANIQAKASPERCCISLTLPCSIRDIVDPLQIIAHIPFIQWLSLGERQFPDNTRTVQKLHRNMFGKVCWHDDRPHSILLVTWSLVHMGLGETSLKPSCWSVPCCCGLLNAGQPSSWDIGRMLPSLNLSLVYPAFMVPVARLGLQIQALL